MIFPPDCRTVAVVAPAGALAPERFDAGIARLRKEVEHIRVGAHVRGPSPVRYLSAGIPERVADLEEAWLDPEVDLILAVRGGFGSAHLLERLNWKKLAAHPDIPLVGYSDITALHWAMTAMRTGRPVAAPMLGKLPETAENAYLRRELAAMWSRLRAEILPPPGDAPLKVLRPGRTRALPLTGNLSVAATLIGTRFLPDVEDRILIVEDLNEPVYKLDRYLTQFAMAGILQRCRALVFGQFTDCGPREELEALFRRFAAEATGPVLMNFPFGHAFPFAPLDFSVPLEIDGDRIFRCSAE